MTEALCATCLLLKMASADIGADKKLDSLWNVVLDMDRQLFVSEKFLTVASDDGMYYGLHLISIGRTTFFFLWLVQTMHLRNISLE